MIPYPQFDPDILRIGPLHIRWYGLMYLLGFVAAYLLIRRQDRSREIGLTSAATQDLLLWLMVGLIAGARAGYLIFYQFTDINYYWQNPLEIIAVWHGGMSFHGGLIGALTAGVWFCRRRGLPTWAVADSVIVTAPVGLGLGRLGNFINGELFGRVTDVPWAMVFPQGGALPRHPSQLYEAVLEGLVLFIVLWQLRRRKYRDGMMVVFFLCFYGGLRFFIEFFRAPDPQIGLLWHTFTMGQILCLAMVSAGICLSIYLRSGRTAQDPHLQRSDCAE